MNGPDSGRGDLPPDEEAAPSSPDQEAAPSSDAGAKPPGAGNSGAPAPAGVPREVARAAKDECRAVLDAADGVQGVGLARADDGGWVVVINVTTATVREQVAGHVGQQADWPGAPVRIRVTGTPRALSDDIGPGPTSPRG